MWKSEIKMVDRKVREVVIFNMFFVKLLWWWVCVGLEVREGSVFCFYEIVGEVEWVGLFII